MAIEIVGLLVIWLTINVKSTIFYIGNWLLVELLVILYQFKW
jgi:hypothetical protein